MDSTEKGQWGSRDRSWWSVWGLRSLPEWVGSHRSVLRRKTVFDSSLSMVLALWSTAIIQEKKDEALDKAIVKNVVRNDKKLFLHFLSKDSMSLNAPKFRAEVDKMWEMRQEVTDARWKQTLNSSHRSLISIWQATENYWALSIRGILSRPDVRTAPHQLLWRAGWIAKSQVKNTAQGDWDTRIHKTGTIWKLLNRQNGPDLVKEFGGEDLVIFYSFNRLQSSNTPVKKLHIAYSIPLTLLYFFP